MINIDKVTDSPRCYCVLHLPLVCDCVHSIKKSCYRWRHLCLVTHQQRWLLYAAATDVMTAFTCRPAAIVDVLHNSYTLDMNSVL